MQEPNGTDVQLADGEDPGRRRRGSRQRGELTRQRILEAVMRVIAREGVRGVTHRTVAAEAGVNLSLTTYYFVDRYDLIASAFRAFVGDVHGELEGAWDGLFRHLDKLREEGDGRAQRTAMRDYVARRFTSYVAGKIVDRPLGLAVEHHFFFEALFDPRLTELARQHRARLLEPMVRLCEFFGSADPDLDADLLFGTIIRLEYESLMQPQGTVDRRRLRASIQRMVGWIAGVE